MDVKEVENLKKKISEYNDRVVRIETRRDIVIKNVMAILKNHGIDNINDYKKLIELRDTKAKEAEALVGEIETKLSTSQEQLNSVENRIAS